jgi:DNA-binding response OmpR family regulator
VSSSGEHIPPVPAVLSFTHFSRLDYELATPLRRTFARVALVAALRESAEVLYAGELEIRLGEGLVLATGQALTLSVREFELLAAMARRIGAIVTRDELYGAVWGRDLRTGDRSVDVYVSKLRGKLEAAMPDRRFIHTHPGFGYRFQPQPAAGAVQSPPPTADARETSTLSQDVHIAGPSA